MENFSTFSLSYELEETKLVTSEQQPQLSQQLNATMDKLVVSVQENRQQVQADVIGEIPKWLNGSLLRVGPGKWDLKGGFVMNNWLDGCALIAKIQIDDGQVSYSSRFVESDAYKKMMTHGKPVYTEFGTKAYPDPDKNIMSRLINTIVPSDLTDNDISNIYTIQDEVYVATESCNIWRIDPESLEAKNKLNLDKMVGINICGSHPHYSHSDGNTYNLGASFLSGMKYHIMKINPMPEKQEIISKDARAYKRSTILATISSSYKTCFSYTHSFAITENYIIFLEQPLLVNGFKLATCTPKGKPLQECLEWHPDQPTHFHVIAKSTGAHHKLKFQSDALYHFHNINAYEDGNFIVLDVIAYDDPSILDKYSIRKMRNNEWDDSCPPVPRRFVLPLGNLEDFKVGVNLVKLPNTEATAKRTEKDIIYLTSEQLGPAGFEVPVINYKQNNGRKYKYVYGSGVFERGYYANSVCKLDVVNKSATLWRESETNFPGEPVFVRKPDAVAEDDGLLLSLCLEADASKPNYLLILDASNMKEVARANLPRPDAEIPTTIHGIFMPNAH